MVRLVLRGVDEAVSEFIVGGLIDADVGVEFVVGAAASADGVAADFDGGFAEVADVVGLAVEEEVLSFGGHEDEALGVADVLHVGVARFLASGALPF